MNVMGGYHIEELSVGMTACFAKTITEADVVLFATLSTDRNPLHLDEAYAKTTRFGGRIAQGMLSASFISAALANQLPGPGTLYLGQTLNFIAPVHIGDELLTQVTVKEIILEKSQCLLHTTCSVSGKTVLEGEARMRCTCAKDHR